MRSVRFGVALLVASQIWAAGAPVVGYDASRACLTVGGKPFFAIGCYNIVPEQMKACAAAGMNVTVRLGSSSAYGPKLAALMQNDPQAVPAFLRSYADAAGQAGMWLVEAPASFNPGLGYTAPDFPERFARFLDQPLGTIVDTLRDHPAVLAINNLDEPNRKMQEPVTAFTRAVRTRQPGRAVMLNFSRRPHEWPGAADIIASDIYIAGAELPLCELYEEVRTNVAIAGRLRCPYWLLPLAEGYETVGPVMPEQQIAQTYLGVIGGATGIVWWTWPPRHAETWRVLRQLSGELRALAPVLTEARPDPPVQLSPPELARTVQTRVIRHGKLTFVIAANAVPSPVTVTFQAPATFKTKAEVWFEKRSLPLPNGRWQDRFAGYGRHVYVLPGAWPAGAELKLTAAVDVPAPAAAGVPAPAARTAADSPPGNLITNPGFEEDGHWTVVPADRAAWADIAQRGTMDATMAHGGRRSACLCFTEDNILIDTIGDPIQLRPNTFYRFSGWMRLETAGALHRAYLFMLGGNKRLTGRLLGVENHAGWQYVESVFNTGPDAIEARVRFRYSADDDFAGVAGAPGNGRAWLDDVALVALPGVRNLVRNGGFERETRLAQWPRDWDQLWSLTGVPGHIGGDKPLWGTDVSVAWEGKRSLRMANPGPTTSLPLDFIARSATCHHTFSNLTLQAGQTYVCSVYLKADRAAMPVTLFVGSYRNAKQATVGTEWARVTQTLTPERTSTGEAYLQVRTSEAGTVWVDGVQLEAGETPTEFQDAL